MTNTIHRFNLAFVLLIAGLLTSGLSPVQGQVLPVLVNKTSNVRGSVGGTSTVTYSFTVPVNGDVTFTLQSDTNVGVMATFIDAAGGTFAPEEFLGPQPGLAESVTWGHFGPGTTYGMQIAVDPTWGGAGTYKLSTIETPATYVKKEGTVVGPSNTTQKAIPLSGVKGGNPGLPGATVTTKNNLGYSTVNYETLDMVDYYLYKPTGDGDVTFTVDAVDFSTLGLMAALDLLDKDGNLLLSESISYGASRSLTVPHLGQGATYYLAVWDIDWYGGIAYGSYKLSASETEATEKPQKKLCDSFAHAAPLALTAKTSGLLGYSTTAYTVTPDTADYFKLPKPTKSGMLTVDVKADSMVSAQVVIWDDAGNPLASFITNDGTPLSGKTSYRLQSGNQYYVSVLDYGDYTGYTYGGYTLTTTFK